MNLDDPISLPSEDLFFHVDLRFGFLGGKGTNDYYAFVATPEAMKKHRSILSGKKVIIVGENPIEDMLTSINSTIQQCTATDSLSAFSELSKFYEWEYENYRVTDD
ncbi:MAG: Imm8 family immunity protein [Akkermansiaceae bacterium]